MNKFVSSLKLNILVHVLSRYVTVKAHSVDIMIQNSLSPMV